MTKKFFTRLYSKKLNIRNNVKSAMIQEMLYQLHGCMDNDHNSISSIYNVPSFNMIPLAPPSNPFTEWSEERSEIPCMNVDCEWIQHMEIFYQSYELFLLPGLYPNGYCKVCQLALKGCLDRSKLKLIGTKSITIT